MRVLVAHGSEHGGTAGLGHMIAEAFVDHGIQADVGDAALVDDVSGYNVVILGGALYNDRWHRDAREFAERQSDVLRTLPVWLFSSGPLNDTARSGGIAPVDGVRRLARDLEVRGHMTFGGVLLEANVTIFDALRNRRPGDWRSPEQAQEWVRRILTTLAQTGGVRRVPEVADANDSGLRLLNDQGS